MDHVLNIAYNLLCHGDGLEDLERLRNDEVYLDALGAQRIPDPTTAGDFCRRFAAAEVETLMDTINAVRVKVWQDQPQAFFEEAILDADGTIAPTTGQCKEGMDMSYKGLWGYHPLLVSLAQAGGRALRLPVDNLLSNWAYMVMASLAWSLKAWFALRRPETGRWSRKHQAEKQTVLRMEFKKFRHAFIMLSCQIVRSGRRIVYRLLSWNRWLPVLFRDVQALRSPLRC